MTCYVKPFDLGIKPLQNHSHRSRRSEKADTAQEETMKKLQITLLILASSILSTNTAVAQNKPLACQDVAVGGLQWEDRRWTNSTFKDEKFILVLNGDTFTKESVGKF